MFQTKKGKIIIAVVAAVLLVVAIVVVILHKADNGGSNPGSSVSIVGTWYSDKPDSMTFTKDGKYQGNSWNGGNAWLTSGSYSIDGSTLTLSGDLDGKTTLTISKDADGKTIISGKYNYYSTEADAKAKIAENKNQQSEDKANIVPNTVNKLLGEWTSLDGSTTCTFTEKSFTIHFKGNSAVAEDSQYYEYEIISDTQMKVTQSGQTNTYSYSLYDKDGVTYFVSPIKAYASTYTKGSAQDNSSGSGTSSAAAGTSGANVKDTVISSVKNPDVSSYTDEQAAAVAAALLGTWKGTFDETPTADSVYWTYTFNADGTYSFSNSTANETGTYTVSNDPNDNYYHSALNLNTGKATKTVKFYFTGKSPIRMITDGKNDPTFVKQ